MSVISNLVNELAQCASLGYTLFLWKDFALAAFSLIPKLNFEYKAQFIHHSSFVPKIAAEARRLHQSLELVWQSSYVRKGLKC